jgi:hypothetical protein
MNRCFCGPAAIADMARTAQADTDIGRQLQQAAASSDDISATLGKCTYGYEVHIIIVCNQQLHL